MACKGRFRGGDNGTAGLVITMGHGEGREQAGSVDGAQMLPREPSTSSKTEPKCAPFAKTNGRWWTRSSASRPAHRASWGVGGDRSWGVLGGLEVVRSYASRSDRGGPASDSLQRSNRANANTSTHPRTSHGLHVCMQNRLPPWFRWNRPQKRASRTPPPAFFLGVRRSQNGL